MVEFENVTDVKKNTIVLRSSTSVIAAMPINYGQVRSNALKISILHTQTVNRFETVRPPDSSPSRAKIALWIACVELFSVLVVRVWP